jgi:hypothetical protein
LRAGAGEVVRFGREGALERGLIGVGSDEGSLRGFGEFGPASFAGMGRGGKKIDSYFVHLYPFGDTSSSPSSESNNARLRR